MKIPCTRDCPNRSTDCHARCEKYKAYAQHCAEQRARRYQNGIVIAAASDGIARVAKTHGMGRGRGRR